VSTTGLIFPYFSVFSIIIFYLFVLGGLAGLGHPGRPDLAGASLIRVRAPTLLIVGGDDVPVIAMNRDALMQLRGEKRLEIVPGATHLFEEPGALEAVARHAAEWFQRYLRPR